MNNDKNISKCKTCFMELPSEHFHGDDCIFCINYKSKWENRDYKSKEIELRKIFDYFKAKHKNEMYDCIVPLSGGKDSTYVLYLAVKKFGLRPLTVTFDNGLQTELARENIRNAVTELGSDHITIAPNKKELQSMYREFFIKTGNICTVCNHIINTTILRVSEKFNLPLIIVGGVSKLELAPIYGKKRYCMEDVFKKVLGNSMNFNIEKYCNKKIRMENEVQLITIFNYLDYDYNEVLRILKTELDWKESLHGDTKIDCRFHPLISYFKFKNNAVSSSILMTSALLRDNKISPPEYEKRILEIKEGFYNINHDNINEFYTYLQIDETSLLNSRHILDYVESYLNEDSFNDLIKMKNDGAVDDLTLIEKLIDLILPDIKRDGGGIKIIDFYNNELRIELTGACKSCLQLDDTMIPHIETLVKTIISDKISVERFIGIE